MTLHWFAATVALSTALGALGVLLFQEIRKRMLIKALRAEIRKFNEAASTPPIHITHTYPQRPEDWN